MQAGLGIKREQATLGGGCFWCLQPVFEDLNGVEHVIVGYAGGEHTDPDYQLVGWARPATPKWYR